MIACREAKTLFSPYMDGALAGTSAQEVSRHLRDCCDCETNFRSLQSTQTLVASIGRKQPPAELAVRLRIALARERAEQRKPALFMKLRWDWHPVIDRIEDGMRSFMLPATAGFVSAIICFAAVIGFFALPSQLSALDQNDVPSGLFMPARLSSVPFTVQDDCGPDLPVVVEAFVDENGRVQDYRIVSNEPESELPKLRPQLDNALIFAQFEPAVSFGKPTSSRVLISFSRVNVHA